jgi:hypothetical protein
MPSVSSSLTSRTAASAARYSRQRLAFPRSPSTASARARRAATRAESTESSRPASVRAATVTSAASRLGPWDESGFGAAGALVLGRLAGGTFPDLRGVDARDAMDDLNRWVWARSAIGPLGHGPVLLGQVAISAGHHDVRPVVLATSGDRNDVIDRGLVVMSNRKRRVGGLAANAACWAVPGDQLADADAVASGVDLSAMLRFARSDQDAIRLAVRAAFASTTGTATAWSLAIRAEREVAIPCGPVHPVVESCVAMFQ